MGNLRIANIFGIADRIWKSGVPVNHIWGTFNVFTFVFLFSYLFLNFVYFVLFSTFFIFLDSKSLWAHFGVIRCTCVKIPVTRNGWP